MAREPDKEEKMIEALTTFLTAMITLAVFLVAGAFAIIFIDKHFNTSKREKNED